MSYSESVISSYKAVFLLSFKMKGKLCNELNGSKLDEDEQTEE